MRTRQEIPPALLDLAARQHRVVHTQQIRDHGLSDRVAQRLVRTSVWRRLDRSLTLVTNSPPSQRNYLAGAFLLVPDALACATTALSLHGLRAGGLPIEVTSAADTHLTHRQWLRLRRFDYDRDAATEVDGFAVVGIIDALVSSSYSLGVEESTELALRAVALRKCTADDLADAVRSRRNLPHRRLLLDVLADAAAGLHSRLEVEHEKRVRRPHRLPEPHLQYRLPTGKIADLAFPDYRVLVELDGRRSHELKQAADRTRDNRHSIAGWRTLRFGWLEVIRDPCAVAADIAAALTANGWGGTTADCRRCLRTA